MDAPGIARRTFGFVDEHRHLTVDLPGQRGITAATKHRAGVGIGVEQVDIGGGELEEAAAIAQVLDPGGEEEKVRLRTLAAKGEQGELVAAMHAGEYPLPVLEVVQGSQTVLPGDVLEIGLGGIVGGDAGGADESGTTILAHQA